MNENILDNEGVFAQGDREFSVKNCFVRGFQLFKKEWLIVLGSLIVFSLISLLANWLFDYIDFVGALLYTVFSACLYAGFFLILHQIAKGKSPEFTHLFGGFKPRLIARFALYQLVYYILAGVASIPLIIGLFATTGAAPGIIKWFEEGMNPENVGAILGPNEFSGAFFVLMGLSLVLFIVLGLSYLLTTPLIILKNKGFWEAMELSRRAVWSKFFPFLGLVVLLFLLNILGVMALILGIFITISISLGVLYAAYESFFETGSDGEDMSSSNESTFNEVV